MIPLRAACRTPFSAGLDVWERSSVQVFVSCGFVASDSVVLCGGRQC